ncbi:M56 family metallopeptidase, partial [Nonlabens ulvanivorans]
MEAVIEYLLKSAGVLSIFVFTYHFLLRRLTFFQANRWFLFLGIIASIAFPLIEITQTVYVEQPIQQYTYVPQQVATPMAIMLEQPAIPVDTPFDYWQLFGFLYVTVMVFFIGKMIVELSSLYRLIRSGKTVKSGNFVTVTLSRKLTPFSFFNYICISESEEPSAALDVILDHEKVHARQWHSIDVLLSHLYRAIFWINPLAWWLKKQIGENLEFIADAEAKTQTKSGVSYERTLLSSAAFHLQPSLANNFFTPFIKKRIMMLQKEASARWNAYKYALILPVIVVFLYSFNVVTEVEYLELENDPTLEIQNSLKESNYLNMINAVKVSKADSILKTSEELIYDITAQTTDEDLDRYASQINDHANYQVKFSDQERDERNRLKRLSISTKFTERKWDKNMTIGTEPFKLLLIKASKEKLWVNDDNSSETLYITKDGVHVEMGDDWTYGDLNIEQDENFQWSEVNSKDVKIYIKITPTSTKESLEEHKKFLKESHNVDFKYSKLRYKEGKLVSIKIELDDNDGAKIAQTYKNDTAIPNICINGSIKGDHKNWKLNNCEDAPQTTYQLGDVKYMNLSPDEYHQLTQMNVDSIMQTIKLSTINMDSLQNQIDLQLMNINFDSIESHIQKSLIYINSDSIGNYYQELPDLNDLDDIDYSRFEMPNSNLSSGNYIVMNNSDSEKQLVIVDGKESNDSVFSGNMDMSNVASMNILKGEDATDLYGEKGKDGVVIIVTKDGEGLKKLSNTDERRMLLDKKRIEMDSLRSTRRSELELRKQQIMADRRVRIDSLSSIKRDQAESRRQELLQRRDEKRQEINNRRNSEIREFRFASKPQYNGEYKIMN